MLSEQWERKISLASFKENWRLVSEWRKGDFCWGSRKLKPVRGLVMRSEWENALEVVLMPTMLNRGKKSKTEPVPQASITGKLGLLSVTEVTGRSLVRAHLLVNFCLTGWQLPLRSLLSLVPRAQNSKHLIWADEKKAIVLTNVLVAGAPIEVCQEKFGRTTKEFCSKHSCLTLSVTKPMMTSKPYSKKTPALQ